MVGSKQAFEVSLADVSQTNLQGKNDVMLEFHVDDTTGANEVYIYIYSFGSSNELIQFGTTCSWLEENLPHPNLGLNSIVGCS